MAHTRDLNSHLVMPALDVRKRRRVHKWSTRLISLGETCGELRLHRHRGVRRGGDATQWKPLVLPLSAPLFLALLAAAPARALALTPEPAPLSEHEPQPAPQP
eukprot:COSAG02_NODE_39278_length_419_cov_0.659375_1_plen_102_part_10